MGTCLPWFPMETRLVQALPLCALSPHPRQLRSLISGWFDGGAGISQPVPPAFVSIGVPVSRRNFNAFSNSIILTYYCTTSHSTKLQHRREFAFEIPCESHVYMCPEKSWPLISLDNLLIIDFKNLSFPWHCHVVLLGRERGDFPGCWYCPDHHSTLPALLLINLNWCLKDPNLVFSFRF